MDMCEWLLYDYLFTFITLCCTSHFFLLHSDFSHCYCLCFYMVSGPPCSLNTPDISLCFWFPYVYVDIPKLVAKVVLQRLHIMEMNVFTIIWSELSSIMFKMFKDSDLCHMSKLWKLCWIVTLKRVCILFNIAIKWWYNFVIHCFYRSRRAKHGINTDQSEDDVTSFLQCK
jgi:hypothetical protein